MLRASSLGLYLPPTHGLRPCLLTYKTQNMRMGHAVSQIARSPSHYLEEKVRRSRSDSQVKETFREKVNSQNGHVPLVAEPPLQDARTQFLRTTFELPPEQGPRSIHRKSRDQNRQDGMRLRKTFDIHDTKTPQQKTKNARQLRLQSSTTKTNPRNTEQAGRTSPVKKYITNTPYPTGLPWRPIPVRHVWIKQDSVSPRDPSNEGEMIRRNLLRTLGTTSSVQKAWEAYSTLVANYPGGLGEPVVPFLLMHRLCRVLARHKPKTRTEFMRLHSVLVAIRTAGGTIQLHEWNALIDSAGKGLRKTSTVDYETALSFYKDMTMGYPPGTTLSKGRYGAGEHQEENRAPPVKPDIYTYTSLIYIAARTSDSRCFRHANMLLQTSGLPPNRITHLALVKYFTATKQLAGVRSTLLKMEQQNLDVGLDGINALLLSYGRNDRLDVVMMIYRLLRHNAHPETYTSEDNDTVESVARQLQREEFIVIPPDMKPNEVTYTTVIQIMAYHGNLLATLTAFVDMISAPNLEKGAPLIQDRSGALKPTTYKPTVAVFRAIFLGFARHGFHLPKSGIVPPHLRAANPLGQPSWTLPNLDKMFTAFLDLPEDVQPSRSVIYWVIVGFGKTSGNDVALLRRIWKQIEERFKGPWGGPDNRLRRMKAKIFPEEQCSDCKVES